MRHKRRRVEIVGLKLHFSYQDWRAMCHLGGSYQRAMHLHLAIPLPVPLVPLEELRSKHSRFPTRRPSGHIVMVSSGIEMDDPLIRKRRISPPDGPI